VKIDRLSSIDSFGSDAGDLKLDARLDQVYSGLRPHGALSYTVTVSTFCTH